MRQLKSRSDRSHSSSSNSSGASAGKKRSSSSAPVVVCSSSFKRYQLEERGQPLSLGQSDGLLSKDELTEFDLFLSLGRFIRPSIQRISGKFRK